MKSFLMQNFLNMSYVIAYNSSNELRHHLDSHIYSLYKIMN